MIFISQLKKTRGIEKGRKVLPNGFQELGRSVSGEHEERIDIRDEVRTPKHDATNL